ncbi:MAG TPA: MerR family transcriptional regulator [Gaiellaceae bacterium]|nr:MerR family transcriptional regulator [Gaiellaceae bacterium]
MPSPRRAEDLLEPVDLDGRLRQLELSLGQVCRVAGISKMQLDYWTTKGRIPTRGRKQRLYDVDAVETVMLIKQGKDKGLSLEAAIEAAERFKAGRAGGRAASGERRR